MSDSALDWNIDTCQQLQLPHPEHLEDGHTHTIPTIYLQGNHLVSGSADQTVRVWDLRSQRLLYPSLRGHTRVVRAVQFDSAPRADAIITASEAEVLVWRFSTGEAVKKLEAAHDGGALALHFDHRYLVTGARDGKIKLWNRHSLDVNDADVPDFITRPARAGGFPMYSLLATFEGHEKAVLALQLRDDVLVSGAGDSTICIWSVKTGEVLQRIAIHQSGVKCLQYNGCFIVSGSTDNSVKIYDVEEQVAIARLQGHANIISSIHVRHNDNGEVESVISGSYDGSIRFWQQVLGSQRWRTRQQLDVSSFHWDEDVNFNDDGIEFGNRIHSIALDTERLVCCGQGPLIHVWDFGSPHE